MKKRKDLSQDRQRPLFVTMFLLLVVYFMLAASSAQALTNHGQKLNGDSDKEAKANIGTTSKDVKTSSQSCMHLVNKKAYKNPADSMSHRRASAAAAAIGLIFGVRVELPNGAKISADQKPARFDYWGVRDGQSERAGLVDYKRCVTDKTRKEIDEWRWTR